MFVKWRRRERLYPRCGQVHRTGTSDGGRPLGLRATASGRRPDATWYAALAETRRVHGKPRQSHVCYLGGIAESALGLPAWRREFWDKASAALDALGARLAAGDRAAIEAALAAKVPPLTDAELAGLERGRAALAPMLEDLAARGLQR